MGHPVGLGQNYWLNHRVNTFSISKSRGNQKYTRVIGIVLKLEFE